MPKASILSTQIPIPQLLPAASGQALSSSPPYVVSSSKPLSNLTPFLGPSRRCQWMNRSYSFKVGFGTSKRRSGLTQALFPPSEVALRIWKREVGPGRHKQERRAGRRNGNGEQRGQERAQSSSGMNGSELKQEAKKENRVSLLMAQSIKFDQRTQGKGE